MPLKKKSQKNYFCFYLQVLELGFFELFEFTKGTAIEYIFFLISRIKRFAFQFLKCIEA